MRSLRDTIFHMNTNVLKVFHICISVSLQWHKLLRLCPSGQLYFGVF